MSPRPAIRKPRLKLSVQYAAGTEGAPDRARIRRWVSAALQEDAEITVRIVDEPEGRALNRNYRGKDCATNVLAFGYDDLPLLGGDLVLCAPVVEREARQQRKDSMVHYAHLVVHGVLHLQGYEHETDAGAQRMEKLEAQILEKMGYADPYAAEGGNKKYGR